MSERIRVLRIIARLNVGGPAIHVTLATAGLDPARYDTRLLAGEVGEGEGDMAWYARERGVAVESVPGLGREIRALGDIAAARQIARVIREWRPHIVHTHTAKAGTLGRLAARFAGAEKPRLVHTFHGHVLTGYFGPAKERVFRAIERHLARRTHRLVVPAARLVDELVGMKVGRREQYVVVPLGFELAPFLAVPPVTIPGPLRAELGIPAGAIVAGVVGRLTAIKNHALLFAALARTPDLHLAVIGDGELRVSLAAEAASLGIRERVHFAGWRQDLAAVYCELDFVALSSLNEGTPVAAIEAMASARAVVSTAVGGVADLIADGRTGILVPSGDEAALAAALARLAKDAGLRARLAAAGRADAGARFPVERLLRDLDALYTSLLDSKP